jgi:tetratricopeptide (TPR) repeat protein
LVDAQVTLGRFVAAESTLARWRRRFGTDASYEVQVGLMASARGDWDSASSAFRRGVVAQGTPGHTQAATWLASVASTRGKLAEARQFARQAFEADRTSLARARWTLLEVSSELYYGLDRNRVIKRLDSLRASQSYGSIEPTSRPFADLAMLYVLAGRPEQGRTLFLEGERELQGLGPNAQRLLTAPPHQMLSNAFHGAVLLQAGKFEEAAERFERAAKTFNGVLWLPEIALALDRGGSTDSALAAYERYLASTWDFRLIVDRQSLGPTLRRVGELYEERGDHRRAVESYRKFVELWQDADPVLQPQVADVRGRLAELAGESP